MSGHAAVMAIASVANDISSEARFADCLRAAEGHVTDHLALAQAFSEDNRARIDAVKNILSALSNDVERVAAKFTQL
jgi:hypothetical protein